ncbi:hypothetical protein K523DRAFT_135868 [Schizophyllum commune Tattone D]|nr:hypothetical protein K523DRAFT_135868 [Schizophyllum commune Tattone D]
MAEGAPAFPFPFCPDPRRKAPSPQPTATRSPSRHSHRLLPLSTPPSLLPPPPLPLRASHPPPSPLPCPLRRPTPPLHLFKQEKWRGLDAQYPRAAVEGLQPTRGAAQPERERANTRSAHPLPPSPPPPRCGARSILFRAIPRTPSSPPLHPRSVPMAEWGGSLYPFGPCAFPRPLLSIYIECTVPARP